MNFYSVNLRIIRYPQPSVCLTEDQNMYESLIGILQAILNNLLLYKFCEIHKLSCLMG
jgi:hypothetical protein